ncbi:hypothetical protein [Henriciella algicola]|uniref:DUF4276 family protein n=1 Tax=Henriciella algicola TaxID=1608422 RepID=A0A399RN84_9PROT|nr:hypothetical protein [Henriciella algicola]RIJ31125.1 hypothetical protein D1222_02335 [Henriciella algicola]
MVLFSEDILLEQAARRIIASIAPNVFVGSTMGNKGYNYFAKSLPSIKRSLNGIKFVVFLDGDKLGQLCPIQQIHQWFGDPVPPNLCLRFAIHEVETWLICDRTNLANFLSVSPNVVPDLDDSVPDTKEVLLGVARKSRDRGVRDDMLPAANHSSAIGPAYNSRLTEFIQDHWDINEARGKSESLDRACRALEAFL